MRGRRRPTPLRYMTIRRFPKHLRRKIHRHFKNYFEERTALDECAILNDLESGHAAVTTKWLSAALLTRHVILD